MAEELVRNENGKVDISHFNLLKVLGNGGFGSVFLVQKSLGTDSGSLYAMKLLKKSTIRGGDDNRSKVERDILVRAKHPFVVNIHYAFQTAENFHLILDYFKGGDLYSLLKKKGVRTEVNIRFYLAEVLLALSYLHSIKIIYRDLKPRNVLIGADGHIALTDFGLSKLVSEHTTTYTFCGTLKYMAPELVSRTEYSYAADWWSFGVMAYQMFTGMLPFRGTNRKETMKSILEAQFAMPTYLSIQAQNLLRALLIKDPSQRLGAGPEGVENLKNHEFFNCINFEDLLAKKVQPGFQLVFRESDDVSSNPEFSNKLPRDSEEISATASGDNKIEEFSFVASSLLENLKKEPETTSKRKFFENYVLLEDLSKGSSIVCKLAKHKVTGKHYAVKIINISECDYREEIDILSRHRHHSGILNLRSVYNEEGKVYQVLQLLRGGDLLDYMTVKRRLTEEESAAILNTLANTVVYLHQNGIVHGGLKPTNVLFASTTCTPGTVTICNMRNAKQLKDDNGFLVTLCGIVNLTPEALKQYRFEAAYDIMCLGIILHIMLSGKSPFVNSIHDSTQLIHQKLIAGKLDFDNSHWAGVSQEAKMLVADMMHLNPENRPTSAQLIIHPWLVSKIPSSNSAYCLARTTMMATFSAKVPSQVLQIAGIIMFGLILGYFCDLPHVASILFEYYLS